MSYYFDKHHLKFLPTRKKEREIIKMRKELYPKLKQFLVSLGDVFFSYQEKFFLVDEMNDIIGRLKEGRWI